MSKNVLQKHWNGSEWVEIHPVTKTTNVLDQNGQSAEQRLTQVKAAVDDHIDDTDVHGATAQRIPGRIVSRDDYGRAGHCVVYEPPGILGPSGGDGGTDEASERFEAKPVGSRRRSSGSEEDDRFHV